MLNSFALEMFRDDYNRFMKLASKSSLDSSQGISLFFNFLRGLSFWRW